MHNIGDDYQTLLNQLKLKMNCGNSEKFLYRYVLSISFCFLILHKIYLSNIVFYNIETYIKNWVYSPFEFKKIESKEDIEAFSIGVPIVEIKSI